MYLFGVLFIFLCWQFLECQIEGTKTGKGMFLTDKIYISHLMYKFSAATNFKINCKQLKTIQNKIKFILFLGLLNFTALGNLKILILKLYFILTIVINMKFY